jgi:hypothetical protein
MTTAAFIFLDQYGTCKDVGNGACFAQANVSSSYV